MRLRTCLGGLLLGLSACVGFPDTIPGDVRIDVDGSSLVFKKKPSAPAPAPAPQPEPEPAPNAPQR
jgi:hypothetical protein